MAVDQKLKEAVNHLQTHAHGMRAVLTIADEIKKVEDIERLSAEADATLTERRKELDQTERNIEAAKGKLADLGKEAEAERKRAADDRASAERQANQIIQNAEHKAQGILAASQKQIADDNTKATASIEGLQAEIRTLTAERDRIASENRTEVADLEARAKKARDYLQSLAGKG